MKEMIKIGLLILSLISSGCVYNISLFPELKPLKETVLEGGGEGKILLLDISGVISEEAGDGMVEEPSMVARVKEELILAEQDKQIKAVILTINSPGGTVTASDMIYHEMLQFKKRTGIKVIASISGIGASGAYYISMAADKVIAHPTAITGSIGVIMLHMDLHGLLEKFGVGAEAIKSGAQKDMGSPFKELSVESREIFQKMILEMQGRFLEIVAQGRKVMTPEQLKAISDGRIFSAQQARELNLIDQIGHIDSAIDLAKREASLTEAKVIKYRRSHQYVNNIYSRTSGIEPLSLWKLDPKELLRERSVNLFYLWLP